MWIAAGRADEAETHGREASGRTLSVTVHCLRQKQTSLGGYWGTPAVLSLLPVFLGIAFLSLYPLFCFSSTLPLHSLHYPSIHCSVLFSWLLLAGISISSQPALLRLLLGVRLPRHATRFASLTPYLLVPPSRLGTAGRTPLAFRSGRLSVLLSLFTTTLATPKSRKHTCVTQQHATRRIRAKRIADLETLFHCI